MTIELWAWTVFYILLSKLMICINLSNSRAGQISYVVLNTFHLLGSIVIVITVKEVGLPSTPIMHFIYVIKESSCFFNNSSS